MPVPAVVGVLAHLAVIRAPDVRLNVVRAVSLVRGGVVRTVTGLCRCDAGDRHDPSGRNRGEALSAALHEFSFGGVGRSFTTVARSASTFQSDLGPTT
jgi:hypothetical protein